MDDFTPSDLKTIRHSKRANLYHLEHCRVLINGGRVEYVTDAGKRSLYWNIPIANTTSILLGTGTSITQAAMRELAKAQDGTFLLAEEARLTKVPFKLAVDTVSYGDFARAKRGSGTNPGNSFLDHSELLRSSAMRDASTPRAQSPRTRPSAT